ncbi:ATP synthase F1 subunit epsilon [Candidatus Peregrinibacteria bacterium]|nr:ATP synthase F1 subunit epsilon [Candidatus Peregrinibacteria bacterium]
MFHLTIVTPEETTYDAEVKMLIIPEITGEMGILKNHRPVIAKLSIGRLRIIRENDTEQELFISGGYFEFNNNTATILANTAENIEEIAAEEARAARQRAEEFLSHADDDLLKEKLENEIKMHLMREKLAQIRESRK